jgi:hypothetical protein
MSEDAHFHPWELGFKQSGLRHITRALHLVFPSFAVSKRSDWRV